VTSAEHRLAMLQLAVACEPTLVADNCELMRQGPSYTFDTLQQIRTEIGNEKPLCLCVGMDALLGLGSWYRWQELLDIAHIVATARPGWQLPDTGAVGELIQQHRVDESELFDSVAGRVSIVEMTLLPVSATGIRQSLQRGDSVNYLVPESVVGYINQHHLYP